jgi:hypothetical protein
MAEESSWRVQLNDRILHPLTTFVDSHLQVVRGMTILSFVTFSYFTIRQMKGVRRYATAHSIPANVYGDIIKCRVVSSTLSDTNKALVKSSATTSTPDKNNSFQVIHRPLIGTMLSAIKSAFTIKVAKSTSSISVRPFGVHLVTFPNTGVLSQTSNVTIDATTTTLPSVLFNAKVKNEYDEWMLTHLIQPKRNMYVEPVYMDDENDCIVAHCHAKMYYTNPSKSSSSLFKKMFRFNHYFRSNVNISLATLEMGYGVVAEEESGMTEEEVEWVSVLREAESTAKLNKIGVWSDCGGGNETKKRNKRSWWGWWR